MGDISQTNLQLYNQLITLRWSADDLRRARDAYDLVAKLFSGQYRCSGKPFVAHLVGTASVVAATDDRVEMVLAGLLHAAYESGDFGARVAATDQREIVRGTVGAGAEHLVHAYYRTPWSLDELSRAVVDAERGPLSVPRRDVLLLRVANEIDEHADFGSRYCDKGGLEIYGAGAIASMISLADALRAPRLGDECRRLRDCELDAARVPEVLRSTGVESGLIAPLSYWPRPPVMLRDAKRRARATARAIPGARSLVHAVRRWR